jgi:hypothetical protein
MAGFASHNTVRVTGRIESAHTKIISCDLGVIHLRPKNPVN